jgi:transcription antitermination factor NusG
MTCFPWYAIAVAPRKEHSVASAAGTKGFECFLPLYERRAIWSDRVKVSAVPLFPGYVFCRLDVRNRLPLLVTPGVREIVGTARIPTPIDDTEIEAISRALKNGLLLEPCDHLEQGDRVIVTNGPLAGLEGIFLRHRGRDRLILSVSLIGRSVAAEVDRICVTPSRTRPLCAGTAQATYSRDAAAPRVLRPVSQS